MLQSFISYKLIYKITLDRTLSYLSSILFALIPFLINRILHLNLLASWLILLMFLTVLKEFKSFGVKLVVLFSVLLLSFLIHTYFALMNSVVLLVWFLSYLKQIKLAEYKKTFFLLFSCFLWLLILLYTLGFFYNTRSFTGEGTLGFGYYSANLNNLFNPVNAYSSTFIDPFVVTDVVEQKYSGFNYLGFGILFILVIFLIYSLINFFQNKKLSNILMFLLGNISLIIFSLFYSLDFYNSFSIMLLFNLFFLLSSNIKSNTNIVVLFFSSMLCLFFSFSTRWFIGDFEFFNIEYLDNVFNPIFRAGRAFGRFSWVFSLFVLMYFIIYLNTKIKNKVVLYLILITAITIQLIDLKNVHRAFVSQEFNKTANYLGYNTLKILDPNSQLHLIDNVEYDLMLVYESLRNDVLTNNIYAAQGTGSITLNKLIFEKEMLLSGKNLNDSSAIYIKPKIIDNYLNNPHYKFFMLEKIYCIYKI